MAAKTAWVTWVTKGKEPSQPNQVISNLQNYGMQVKGVPWVDDLEKMSWCDLGTSLLDAANADLWLIIGDREDFESQRFRYGLSMVTAMVQEGRGHGFPIFCLGQDHLPDSPKMPMLTRNFRFLDETDQSWPAKVTAALMKKSKIDPQDFRLNVMGHPFIGQWFEVGPKIEEWDGVMFGVSPEATVIHHLVGPKGQLPEKSTLEYPTEGIKAQVKEVEYTAYSIQNKISKDQSYFVKVSGHPKQILFGGHPGTDKQEVTVLELT